MSGDDPRVNILAEALRDVAPAWTEERGVRWRGFASDLLARLDAADPARNVDPATFDLEDGDGERYTWNPARGMWQHDEVNGSHYERWQIESDYPPVREVPPVGRYVQRHNGAPAADDEPRFDWQAAEEGTEAAIARAEAEAAAPARDDALDRWLDTEIAEEESRLARVVNPLCEERVRVLREVRDRLGATTNTTPEEGTHE